MTLLILGLLLWAGVHFIPSLAQPVKSQWKNALGDKGYKISFALIVVLALVMIVFGWRSTTPTYLYALPGNVRSIAMLLMVFSFILFGAANYSTRIKKYIRHPQLTGLIVWSIAHLLVNGDSRSVVLFSGMGLWAIIEIIAINRREGAQGAVDIPSWPIEFRGIAISLVIFVVVVFAHPYITGMPIR